MLDILPADILASPLLWTLLALQIAMGGFDIVVHHELTERLAWKANAAHELRLHALRNAFYAFLFLFFAWFQPHGLAALVLIVILAVEIVITLWDFVEEDRTRKLPPTERILHTLLAINYGAILALVMPLLFAWTSAPTALVPVSYGWGTLILSIAGLGCLLFTARDLFTSRRAARMRPAALPELGGLLPAKRSVLVTGGSGFIGRNLVESLISAGHDVTVLTRDMANAAVLASPVRVVTSLGQIASDTRIDAIVDLAGEPVAGGLWTRKRRREILRSRLRSTHRVNALAKRLDQRPGVIVTASAIGAYGLSDDQHLTELDAGGSPRAFTKRVCLARERAAGKARDLGIRTVAMRIGLVLDRDGGMLSRMIPAFDLGLGGPIGSAEQWMSWIALDDLLRMIAFAIADDGLEGPLNATAPNPVRNREFASSLARHLNRPAVLPVPALPLELLAGDFARELLLGGQRVFPAKARASGFVFLHASIDDGLSAALRLTPVPAPAGGTDTATSPGAPTVKTTARERFAAL